MLTARSASSRRAASSTGLTRPTIAQIRRPRLLVHRRHLLASHGHPVVRGALVLMSPLQARRWRMEPRRRLGDR
jgi:hypothetical protein